ncbi:Gmad2 immunoglobulin-like domain-containing protein [Cellulomonas fimi]|nr:Gmad2 immunoglobulin-like domain-containing protein [Cellulomonas fimi]MDC7120856.1 Gmad2 immunoglobulin-like domain-containing protein [Cellulomonas fimi]
MRSAGAVVAEGFTTAGANGTVGAFRFTVRLTSGDYTLEVWEAAMAEDGAAFGGDRAHHARLDGREGGR